jgi:Flp pilus assembly protein TadD
VAGAALIGWLNALRAPFIFDDRPHILDNALIRHLGPPWDAVLHTTRPLVGLTLALNYAFGRFDVVGYHALNLGLHVATGLALLAVLRVTLDSAALPSSVRSRGPSLALAITLLWVVHPITTAAVTVTIQRAEVLAALCTLMTLIGVARAAADPRGGTMLAVFACSLGMLSKPVMIAAPMLALAWDRAFLASSWRSLVQRRWPMHVGLWSTALLLALVLMRAPREWRETAGFDAGLNVGRFASVQPFAITHYLGLAVWPARLCLDYGWPAISPVTMAAAIGLLAVLGALCVAGLQRGRRIGFTVLALAILLLPSTVVPTADPVVEHRMYLALAAVIAAIVLTCDLGLRGAAARWPGRVTDARSVATALVAVAVMALLSRTIARNADYRNEQSIWSVTASQRPDHARPRNNLALALLHSGDTAGAYAQLEEAVRIDSNFAAARLNLGSMLYKDGRPLDARPHLQRAVQLDPNNPIALGNLGLNDLSGGRLADAVRELSRAIADGADAPEVDGGLGVALAGLGRDAEARVWLRKAIVARPRDVALHGQLAAVFLRLGESDSARTELKTALALEPNSAGLRSALQRLETPAMADVP